jgi:hypothetical protein
MSLMVETLAEVDAIDFETPYPSFPEFPARPGNWPAEKWWAATATIPKSPRSTPSPTSLGAFPADASGSRRRVLIEEQA